VLRERIAYLGDIHPNTLLTRHNLAWLLQTRGEYRESEKELRLVRTAQEERLGEDHPHTLTTCANLAWVLQAQGRFDEADNLFNKVLEKRIVHLGPYHPDTLTARANLGWLRYEQGNLDAAEHLLDQLLADRTRLLGADHPRTLITRHNLAVVQLSKGDLCRAEATFREVLARDEDRIGSDHPATLATRHNLALALHARGKLAEAGELFQEVLAIQLQRLKPDHPDAMATRMNLASVLRDRENLNRRDFSYDVHLQQQADQRRDRDCTTTQLARRLPASCLTPLSTNYCNVRRGPAQVTVGRADQVSSFRGEDDPDPDPDDAALLDLSLPPWVEMAAPLVATGYEAWAEIGGDRPVGEVIARLNGMLAEGRATAVARAVNDAACAVCGVPTRWPHLLAAAGDDRLRVCPACAFDGDIFVSGDHATAYLAYQIDRLPDSDLSTPAGWAGPAALLACAAGDGFGQRLHQQWRDAGTVYLPSQSWSDPGLIGIWLPPADRRPAPLASLGPGARLAAVVAALDKALPDLRQRVRDEQAENWREADQDPSDSFVEQVWPAAVAYAVSMTTQAAERPRHRPPLQHLPGSFDALHDHLTLLDVALDIGDIESTLGVGIDIITQALDR